MELPNFALIQIDQYQPELFAILTFREIIFYYIIFLYTYQAQDDNISNLFPLYLDIVE